VPVKGTAAPADDIAPVVDPVLAGDEPVAAETTGDQTEA
jgi:hypothetical protein